jgi:hypothetical protein
VREGNISEILTPIAIAYWLAGYGMMQLHHDGVVIISTGSFSPEVVGGQRP